MLFDPDHMSVKARSPALDQLEELQYPGVLSSHSWSTPDAYPRIYRLGGFIAPYAGDSTGFVEKWRRHLGWADPRYYFGFGYGADINGLGAQGDPRGADVANPVTYPFRGLTVSRSSSSTPVERVYDINVDGVAHYGLYPDWIQDLRKVADAGRRRRRDRRGHEPRRGGLPPDVGARRGDRPRLVPQPGCAGGRRRATCGPTGHDARAQVMRAVGQPYTRSGGTRRSAPAAGGEPTGCGCRSPTTGPAGSPRCDRLG